MKLHLPVLLRKALLACFSFAFACSASSAAADLTLGGDASLTIDYAAANSIPDLAGGTLQLSGDTILLLSNCGVGDGKTYTLLTGVGALLDAEGNTLTLTDENKAASLYFDTTQPGTGFWAGGWLQLAPDGTVQLVLHGEEVQEALTISTRQTGSKTYNYYEGICFRDITYTASGFSSAYGGAIGGDTITLSHNGSVMFQGNIVSASSDYANAYGGAIYGANSITLSNNGNVTFQGNSVSCSADGSSAYGGAIYGANSISLCNNGNVTFQGNTVSSPYDYAHGGAIYGTEESTIALYDNGCVTFSSNAAKNGGAIYAQGDLNICNNDSVIFEKNVEKSGDAYRLRSIYASGSSSSQTVISLSAADGKSLEFRDSVFVAGSTVNLNEDYSDANGDTIKQQGDIIFTGKYTEQHLNEILAAEGAGRTATTEEILNSRTTTLYVMTNLYGGCLRVEDGAVYQGYGITAMAESDATVRVKNAELSHSHLTNSIENLTFHDGTTLELAGNNIITGQVQMKEGSTLSFDCSVEQGVTSVNGALAVEGALTLILNAGNSSMASNSVLLYVDEEISGWDAEKITVQGDFQGTLTWVDNSLVWNYNADTHERYYNGSFTFAQRQVGSVCKHHYSDIAICGIRDSALYGYSVTLNHNGQVCIENNVVEDSYEANGGAICGYDDSFRANLSNNQSVTICENQAYTLGNPGNANSSGGAIYSNINGTIKLTKNGTVLFGENIVCSQASVFGNATGGAIFGGCIIIDENGVVEFKENKAQGMGEVQALGGAILKERPGSLSLSKNTSVLFEKNAAVSDIVAHGGAIWAVSAVLDNNGSVEFIGNSASSSYDASGGAIYVATNSSTITLSNNGSVNFNSNIVSVESGGDTSNFAQGGAIMGYLLSISHSPDVKFIGNKLCNFEDFSDTYINTTSQGGALFVIGASFHDLGTLEFSGNEAESEAVNSVLNISNGKTVYASAESAGGAIYVPGASLPLTFLNNDEIRFRGNIASATALTSVNEVPAYTRAKGGAISAGMSSFISICSNKEVEFSGNIAKISYSNSQSSSGVQGGAIFTYGSLHICNNDSVNFFGNVEKSGSDYRLRSVYVYGGSGDVLSISAAAGKSVAFYDSIYVGENATVNLNVDYEDAEGNIIEQKGDIIFSGATTEDDLYKAKGNVDGTADEILLSRTTEVKTVANLYNGRLIIKDGAIWAGDGITIVPAEGTAYSPTLLLQNGQITHYDPSGTGSNVVTVKSGASFEIVGKNTANYTSMVLEGGSRLTFNIDADNTTADSAVLSMKNSSLMLSGGGKVTLQLNAATGLAHGKAYALLSGIAQPIGWNADTITITSGTSGWNAGFSDLTWVDSTLWLYYDARPDLETATWTNESGDGKWNTSSVNWEQNEIDYEYKNGVAVVFDGQGAGTVDLVGELAPGSVLVNNATGQDYTFGGSGSLTGNMKLTKKGAGNLTISTANSYIGGTEIDNSRLTITHANALGTGAIETRGNSSLEVKGVTLALGSTINHSATGTLSLSGNIDASALEKSDSDDVFVDVYGAETKNGSGFVRSGDFTVTVVDEGTVDSSAATIIWNGTSLTMNNGVGSAKGGMLYGTYRILTGHTASSTAIHGYDNGAGANAVVTLVAGGTLNADDANGVNVTATGGTINLSAGALSGNWTNATVNAAGGSLAGSFAGTSTLSGTGFVLGNTAVQNNGTLMLSGSFDASGLVSTATGKDMFVDTSNNVTENGSGFRRTEDFTVLVATGTVDSSNAVATYGGQTLTMTDGTGFGVGSIQYDTYLLKGDDTATVSTIATKAGAALQKIDMQGGTLNVNASTDKLVATGGSIVLSAGTLGGSIGGTAAVTVSGIASISGNNSYTGGTVIDGGSLTITHANALGTGGIVTIGDSKLVVSGVTLVLGDSIANTGKLTLKGSFDASGLTLNRTEEGRLALSGTKVSLAESGFARGVEYSVQIVEGGTTVNDGVSISHRDYLSRTQLVLGEDGVARAGGAVDYTHFFLTGGDSAVVSEIADVSKQHQETLAGVTMDSGSLEVDQSMAVNATGGSIHITDDAVLSGTVEDTAVSTAAGDYSSEISALLKGDTTLEVNGGSVTVSGDNSYTGGTVVNGGSLLVGHDKAFGFGDVAVNDATLDLSRFTIANKVLINGNSTLGHADGAAHIVLGGGSKVNFRDGYALGSGKTLEVAAAGATYAGALTLGGGTLELDGLLTVQGDVTFESGTQTTIDISGWNGANDGEVLATLGSSNSGYTEESLKLAGIAGDWELDFDTATGVLTLVAVKDEPLPEPEFNPNLNRNQQIVYETIKDIMGEGNPGGLLGELGKDVTGTRDEEKLKQLLDELGGAEYATLVSGQQAAARGHMRRLRGEMGCGHLLAGSKTRAYIEAYNHRSEVDGDAHGRGYELNESGGQFALEFLGEDSVSGGFAVAAGRSKLQPDGCMTQKSDNTYMDAFVMHRDGAYTGKFSLGVGVHKYDLDRRVAGNAVSADASGTSVNFMHESAYGVSLSESHSVQVFGAVESSFNRLGAFHEKGADTASLQVESQDAWVTTLSLGARYLYSFAALESAPAATLSLQGGLEFDFGDTDSEVEMNFEGARSHRFRQSGAERDTFGYNLGASLHLPVSAKAAIYASGDAVLRGDSYEVNANVGLQMAF